MDPSATYPPLDTLKPIADRLWIVDSGPIRAFGITLPVRMTVVQLSDGALWLHSPTRYTADLLAAMQRLGPVRHLVAPNIAHWTMLADWQRACPDALTWAVPGLAKRPQLRLSSTRIDRVLGPKPPAAWRETLSQGLLCGAMGYREAHFFHRASRTLILTDLVQNLEADKLPALSRWLLRMAGSTAPDGMAPAYLRLAVKARRRAAAAAARAMLSLAPERVIFAHGAWFECEGTRRLRRALRWLL
ncbi:DUF4336 domain-containing protein [Stakelama saccharophila]|uniref:DUF4336 domain-containing protein n=1 Tax=Stakelama saccharophila TaxID=3075605 RepID=A0ABZ0B8Q7_9SPHN|nr:DUF4336 domain-containing protein [Stakelama sp. W311]WNO53812.1 DUF4336 domain-containing protein [Stakelama sp. W311]